MHTNPNGTNASAIGSGVSTNATAVNGAHVLSVTLV